MGELIMWNIVTVDGYFEGDASWDLPWHDSLWSDDLEKFSIEQLQSAEALLFGRVTYDGMAKYWKAETGVIAEYMNSLPKYVVSGTLKTADWNNSKVISSAIREQIIDLKRKSKKDIYIFGSSILLQNLIESDLIDEYRIGVAPHIHGSGNRLFKSGLPRRDLKLTRIQQVKNDGLVITYRPIKESDATPKNV